MLQQILNTIRYPTILHLFNLQDPSPADVQLIRGHSSVGRAPALQAGGQGFDPPCLHQKSDQAIGPDPGERTKSLVVP